MRTTGKAIGSAFPERTDQLTKHSAEQTYRRHRIHDFGRINDRGGPKRMGGLRRRPDPPPSPHP